MVGDALDRLVNAAGLVAEQAVSVGVGWLLAGLLLHVVASMVRTRGWHTILRASYPQATQLRARHTMAAFMAGSGLNGVIPARGGDVVKLWLVRRRVPESRWTTLGATFVPETLFETLFGIGLVVWALSQGFLPVPTTSGELPQLDVSFVLRHPVASVCLAAVGTAAGIALWRVARRRIQDLRARLAQGVAILGEPRRFVTGVASWQALSRLIRLGSIAAFLAAFGLPVTAATVVLVMAAHGGGRIIPLAPASAGLRVAMLGYGFAEVTGQPVDIAAITVFTAGVGATTLVAGLAVAFACLAAELGTVSPRALRAALRQARAPAAPST